MKHKTLIPFIVSLLFITIILLNSCRDDFTIKEIDNITDTIPLSGTIAIPLVDTELKLQDYLPDTDSSLWAEVDENDLVHLKMYYKDLHTFIMSDVFGNATFGMSEGEVIYKDSITIHSDTSKMRMYDNVLTGKLFFDDPKISFYIKNKIPLATFFKIDSLSFYNEDGDFIVGDDHVTYDIGAPDVYNETVYDTVVINKYNLPSLPDLFSPVPKTISFKFTAGSHTDQELPFDVTGNEEMQIDAEIDLPLKVRLDTIVMADTLDFDWNGDTYDQITVATLKSFFTNGFPVDALVQIYFADSISTGEVGVIVDSVFSETTNEGLWHLESAEINDEGSVINPFENSFEVTIDQDRVDKLRENNASRIIVIAKLNTKDSNIDSWAKIESYNSIVLKMGVKADFEGEANDLSSN